MIFPGLADVAVNEDLVLGVALLGLGAHAAPAPANLLEDYDATRAGLTTAEIAASLAYVGALAKRGLGHQRELYQRRLVPEAEHLLAEGVDVDLKVLANRAQRDEVGVAVAVVVQEQEVMQDDRVFVREALATAMAPSP